VHIAPRGRLGWWTVALAGVAFLGTAALVIAFANGLERADSFSDKPLLTITASAMLASSTAAVITGTLAVFRRHDHAWPVVVATVVGFLIAALSWQQVFEGLGWLES
jgi:hypothetical protein